MRRAYHYTQRPFAIIGDSLAAWYPSASLPAGALNGGVAGKYCFNFEVPSWPIAPSIIYCQIGTNDVYYGHDAATVATDYTDHVINPLRAAYPTSPLVLCEVPPRGDPSGEPARDNPVILALNALLPGLGWPVLTLYSALVGGDGKIDPAYTTDGIHLSAAGYAVWTAKKWRN